MLVVRVALFRGIDLRVRCACLMLLGTLFEGDAMLRC